MEEKKRIYACIDLKSFYASAECVARGLDPLTADLVVADKTRTDKTICLAVSPSLKSYGIPGRPRLFEVNQRLEQVRRSTGRKVDFIIAPPRMAYYVKVSSDIYSIYLEYLSAEDIHVYSIDEVFMDLTDYLSFYNMSARELVMKMVRTVLERTGITATAGIGTNMYLAKIAMDIVAKHVDADKDGVRIAELDRQKFKEFLWGYKPLTDFWGIGRRTADRLRRFGLETMGDIARRSIEDEEFFYKVFGIDGEIMIDHAWGIEPVT
ncbi:MAG: DNA methylase, partial [Clostridiales bacterium]|nr:DNA methylase [Clostridiales bacterium]